MAEEITALPLNESLDIESRLREANERKAEGNQYFREEKWNEALVVYRSALGFLPPASEGDAEKQSTEDAEDTDGPELTGEQKSIPTTSEPQEDRTRLDVNIESDKEKECVKARAILNANIAACHIKLGDHKLAVEACSKALLDDPLYLKALHRRATSNEALDSWTSLTAAQEDYTVLLKHSPSSSRSRELEAKLNQLKPRIEAAQKKETSEMLDKLKGLGNSILGNFGLSTNNFQFEPNGQGGYSMNFVR
ncbi:hypothetical protein BDQ12DRAFT_733323 [Crucibulum laeve]|uniref:TPR-like protein n=1 Tax=Crucibulum laeve TaxID=68775 RepID=A0A5C3M698_9AGAR|nr:hypothetical protein BDQ12DRAFT_733323 [Crucibulum laeve]